MHGLKKNSKKPEVRRQELIDVASALFAEKGYEAVSVRDILNVVDGAPGMFYYYFKSKQDIYIAAMEQYITQRLERKCKIVVPQNKIPVSCAKTANYNRIFINLSLTVCQKNGTLFFLCVSEISVIVVLVATDKKRERTTPTTARSFSHP